MGFNAPLFTVDPTSDPNIDKPIHIDLSRYGKAQAPVKCVRFNDAGLNQNTGISTRYLSIRPLERPALRIRNESYR